MALLFLPLLLDPGAIYPWARPDVVGHDAAVRHKQPYLNVNFFILRAAIYFALWIGLALLINMASKRQDRTEDPSPTRRAGTIAAPGLVLFFLSMTFAAVDWGMSLEPDWYSTIYGVMLMIGQGLSALAAMVVVASFLARARLLPSSLAQPDAFHDVGNLLLAFTMLWAYMSFSQYLIIWSGNLPEEIPWYLRRARGAWEWVALALILFHFFLPFFVLLFRESKQHARLLVRVALLVLGMHWLDLTWLILPASTDPASPRIPRAQVLLSLVALAGIGGIWTAAFIARLKSWPLIPLNDPRLNEVIEHAHSGG
jgi:hypothetical protein